MDEYSKKLLEENLELSKKIQAQTAYIKRFVITSQIATVLKILLIVVPIVLGIIYIPPLVKTLQPLYENTVNMYKTALGLSQTGEVSPANAEAIFNQMSPQEKLQIRSKICQ